MIFFSEKCLEYSFPGHPESPERVKKTYAYLSKKGYQFKEARPCQKEDILLIHTPEQLARIENNDFFDADTPNQKNIYAYAALSVGGALQALNKTLKGENSFSLLRPPGHHAGRNYLGGFCYFNNIAIATAKALKEVDRVAIIDFDGHHGNGTEAIFLHEPKVLFVSLHQYPAYPGTGKESVSNALNFPLQPGSSKKEFISFLREGLDAVNHFAPSLVAVSAGFDAYKKETLLNLNLEIATYFQVGEKIKNLRKPIFAVLEGGYHQDLPLCVESFLQGAAIH